MAAQVSFASAIGLVTTASSLNGNLFLAGGAPILMTGVGIAIVAAITSLTAAARAAATSAAALSRSEAPRRHCRVECCPRGPLRCGHRHHLTYGRSVWKFALAGILASFGFAGIISSGWRCIKGFARRPDKLGHPWDMTRFISPTFDLCSLFSSASLVASGSLL
jgi:hypothetical protein